MYKDTIAGMDKGNTVNKMNGKAQKDELTNIVWSQSQAGKMNFTEMMCAGRRVTQDCGEFSDAMYK